MILKILTSASHMQLDIELYKNLDTQTWLKFILKQFVVRDRDTGKGATVSEKYLNIQSSQSDFFL